LYKKILILNIFFFHFYLNTWADEKQLIINYLLGINNFSFSFEQVTKEKIETGNCLLVFDNKLKCNYTLRLTYCQLCAKLVYMPKNRIFKITEGTETKEVEAMSYKKAVKSYQGGSKAKMITIEWTTKGGELFVKDQKLPLGRKKKIGR